MNDEEEIEEKNFSPHDADDEFLDDDLDTSLESIPEEEGEEEKFFDKDSY